MASIFQKWGVTSVAPSAPASQVTSLATLAELALGPRQSKISLSAPSLAELAELAGGLCESRNAGPYLDEVERAAIMEWSGGLPKDWAEGFARLNPDEPPNALSKPDWVARLDGALSMADVYGQRLSGLGWTFEALFSFGESWLRLDHRSVGWFVAEALSGGGRILDADEKRIHYQKANGAAFTVWRHGLGMKA